MENGTVYLGRILAGPTKWASLLWREAQHEAGDRCAHGGTGGSPAVFGLPPARAGLGRRLEHAGGVGKSFWALERRKTHRRRCSTVTGGRPKGNGGEGVEKRSSTMRYPEVRWYSGNRRRGQRAARAVHPWWSTQL
jgi:hypothetical protein